MEIVVTPITLHSQKAPLPKSRRFVLRSTSLEQALREAGIQLETSLRLDNSDVYFLAYFWPPSPNVPHERLYITAGAVPSAEVFASRDHIDSCVLPRFVAWETHLLSLPLNSPIRREKQIFNATQSPR